jgi:hypothetical protein
MGAIGRAYPENPVSPFASLTSPVRIAGATYAGGLQSYFSTRAANLTAELSAAGRPGSAGGLVWNTASWNVPVANPPSTGNFRSKNAGGAFDRRGRIFWNATTGVLTFGITNTGSPRTLQHPGRLNPLLVQYDANGWRFACAAGAGRADTSCP